VCCAVCCAELRAERRLIAAVRIVPTTAIMPGGNNHDVGYDIDVDDAERGGGDGWINRAPTLFTDITPEHSAAPSAGADVGLAISDRRGAAEGEEAAGVDYHRDEDDDDGVPRDEHRDDDDGTLDGIVRVVESTARVLDKSLEDFQNSLSYESPTKSNNAVLDDKIDYSMHGADAGPTFPSVPTNVEFETSDDDFVGDALDDVEASDKTLEGPGYTEFDDSDTNDGIEGGGGGAETDLVTDTDHSGYYSGSQAIMVQVLSHSGEEVSTLDGDVSTLDESNRGGAFPTFGELIAQSRRSSSMHCKMKT